MQKAGFLMNQLIKYKSEKWLSSQSCHFVNIFSASNVFMQISIVPVMWKQSIKWIHQKLW